MHEIGIRELKAELSRVLRLVEDGEEVRITRHGASIADLVPVGSRRRSERLRELVAAGKVSPASRPRPRRSPRPLAAERSASALVLAEREEER